MIAPVPVHCFSITFPRPNIIVTFVTTGSFHRRRSLNLLSRKPLGLQNIQRKRSHTLTFYVEFINGKQAITTKCNELVADIKTSRKDIFSKRQFSHSQYIHQKQTCDVIAANNMIIKLFLIGMCGSYNIMFYELLILI